MPSTTMRDLPILPPEPTGPTARFDKLDLLDEEEDRTVVDHNPFGGERAPAPREEVRRKAAQPKPPQARGLPLPAPPVEARDGRPTIQGKRTRGWGSMTSQAPAASTDRGGSPERAAPKAPRRRPPAPRQQQKRPRSRSDDAATAVAENPLAALAGPLVGGRYRVVERIGEGGMGKVYKVTHAQLGKTFALKIISESFSDESKARDLFYREARLASSLSHPNIASVVDFGEDDERGAFMVMEFVEGEPLSKVLRREERLSVRYACDILQQVAEALHYIHSNKIVHCDIKTENILVCEIAGTKRTKKQVKLLDFGLARSTNAGRNTSSLSGTPHYVAPERIRGEQPTPSSDIYGLGILAYELLTGKVPWDGNVAAILAGHLEAKPTPPSELIEGGLDPALEKLILHALGKKPEERHKDVAAFIYELRTVMDMLGIGRRQRRAAARKVVIERTENKRDELARRVFDITRVPMALIGANGTILVANTSFAKFVMGVTVDIEGQTVQSTPLATAWTSFETDLARACAGHPVRRMVEVDVGDNDVRKLMMWLDPGTSEETAVFGVHPLDG